MAKAVRNSKQKTGKKGDTRTQGARKQSPARGDARKGRPEKTRPQAKAAARQGERRGLSKFARDVRVEMTKVTWPTRKDLTQSTIVVIVAVIIAGAYVGVLDGIFNELMHLLGVS